MTTHADARELARCALVAVFSGTPEQNEVRALAGIGRLETCYGDGWRGAGVGSHNIGAVQAGKSWVGATFAYTDTHPNADGTSTPYVVAFRKYPTALDGWTDLARVAFSNCGRSVVRAAARTGNLYAVSFALRKTSYYEGFGKTESDRVANHCRALTAAVAAADAATASGSAEHPTIRRGSTGDDVRELQRALGLAADGILGPLTEQACRAYQTAHGLDADGVCGPRTWAHLLAGKP